MRRIALGRTGLTVSEICLGTMTWGSLNTEAEGHAQMDIAIEAGVNFWDTAEMYPVAPVRAETVGRTEEIIGSWLARTGRRNDVVLATKLTGAGQAAVRDGAPMTGALLREAVDGSLRRLRTDVIDLYQLHWPNRESYHFRDIWTFDPRGQDAKAVTAHMLEMLEVAAELIRAGKIRHIALSNESVWGAAKWLALAEAHGLPRMMTVQNEYSLLCRQFDSDWAEFAVMEEMPLLAFSPLATGILSGKYAGDVTPPGSRRSVNATLSGRMTSRAREATAEYVGVAARHGLHPVQMALAFCLSRPFPIIPIIGATSTDQLRVCIGAADLRLGDEVLADIDQVHRRFGQPF